MAIDINSLWFPAYFVVFMFGGALNSRALACSIVAAIGISCVYPDTLAASLITVLYIPAVLISGFRD